MTSTNPKLAQVLGCLDELNERFIVQTDQKEPDTYWVYCDFSDHFISHELEVKKTFTDILSLQKKKKSDQRLPFNGLVGFFSYEFLCHNMGFIPKSNPDLKTPTCLWARPESIIKVTDNNLFKTYSSNPDRETFWQDRIDKFTMNEDSKVVRNQTQKWICNIEFGTYEKIFASVKEHILDGNTYQIKISQRYQKKNTTLTGKLFCQLMQSNPAPESFAIAWEDFSMVSCSPELVIDYRADTGKITTRPIGGTLDRKSTQGLNTEELNERFYSNLKEVHEHNMLIDLERNDLSRVCKTGTVKIDKFRDIETYAHVHHLVSTISGEVKDNVNLQDIIAAILPGGTVTGCPKYRTLELIDHFEPSFRGPYTGSFGTLSDDGSIRLNIIIRTLLTLGDQSYVQAGGGIVVDSTPSYEYNENQIKARALLDLF